jgi:hypothetical protein
MLRHADGYQLANDGHDTWAIQDYLGHRISEHDALYALAPEQFVPEQGLPGMWRSVKIDGILSDVANLSWSKDAYWPKPRGRSPTSVQTPPQNPSKTEGLSGQNRRPFV